MITKLKVNIIMSDIKRTEELSLWHMLIKDRFWYVGTYTCIILFYYSTSFYYVCFICLSQSSLECEGGW